jgi:hypothetical protein
LRLEALPCADDLVDCDSQRPKKLLDPRCRLPKNER